VVPNPINTKLYEVRNDLNKIKNQQLKNILTNESKPKLLIFGGGSGSEDINSWAVKNIKSLLEKFQVIHLTGLLQKKKLEEIIDLGYVRLESLFEDMPVVMKNVDLVLCRAGVASITELLYLQKPAFLVPLPHSHQEENANQVKDYFQVLHQKDNDDWLKVISTRYPKMFANIKYPSTEFVKMKQEKYFQKLRILLDKSE
jgi:UDP-N-acetylglucosamine:LPS N-acetylglucosamine transferase